MATSRELFATTDHQPQGRRRPQSGSTADGTVADPNDDPTTRFVVDYFKQKELEAQREYEQRRQLRERLTSKTSRIGSAVHNSDADARAQRDALMAQLLRDCEEQSKQKISEAWSQEKDLKKAFAILQHGIGSNSQLPTSKRQPNPLQIKWTQETSVAHTRQWGVRAASAGAGGRGGRGGGETKRDPYNQPQHARARSARSGRSMGPATIIAASMAVTDHGDGHGHGNGNGNETGHSAGAPPVVGPEVASVLAAQPDNVAKARRAEEEEAKQKACLLYTSPSPRDRG